MLPMCDFNCLQALGAFTADSNSLLWMAVGLIGVGLLMSICHEAGHFYAARICGIGSTEFSIGMGPTLLRVSFAYNWCDLVVRILPFGGRVEYDERYEDTTNLQRAFIASAGWLADVSVVVILYLAMETQTMITQGPTGTAENIIFWLASGRAYVNLLPITSDGRNTAKHLWMAFRER